jgi:UDP-N-acetyl-D-mannosaminuronic acid dehydrogenase
MSTTAGTAKYERGPLFCDELALIGPTFCRFDRWSRLYALDRAVGRLGYHRLMPFPLDVVVVGGCGHVGLPLGLALADRGRSVRAFDINPVAVDLVGSAKMPFDEPGAQELLERGTANGSFGATTDPSVITDAEVVIVVIGTPIDEHLNPDPQAVPNALEALSENLRSGQLIVLRSTVYPGVTRLVEQLFARLDLDVDVAFCPERIAEGRALTELYELPQIVSGCGDRAAARAASLFGTLTESILRTSPEEAELAKLFTNTWRYIKFAAANQFYMIANDFGLDFERIREAITTDYPRAADMPGAGFAAGPCLLKDTMQLAAFNNNNFTLGHASMMVNEGLPLYVVARMQQRFDLSTSTVGILGMSFKADSDDVRSSLSYKLRRILRFKARRVVCTDPYVAVDQDLMPLDEVLDQADIVVLATPHSLYRSIEYRQPIVDIWNLKGDGVKL